MKKLNILSFIILMLLPVLTGCQKDEIVFDSEMPRFPLRSGYQLLEVIVPQGTLATDKIYITGEFNGGAEAAVGNPMWQLEKASDTDAKWGIYLNPSNFVEGKTLADGYTFVNSEQGVERSLDNQDVLHKESPALGQRQNVIVNFWADQFNKPVNPDEVVHDGFVIYVIDNTEYEELTMYAWGDAEAFGGWPGMAPTGKIEIDGTKYTYFDTGEANKGLNLNLIFNNNGGGKQLGDYNVTLEKDFYLELTPDGVSEYDPESNVKHDGYAIFVYDLTGWEELALYSWGDSNDLHGGWPGMAPTGTQRVNGVNYTYFDLGAANCDAGLTQHFILNNNGAGSQVDDIIVYAMDRDVYLEVTSKGATEIDPETYVPGDMPEPEPEPEGTEYKLYVQNLTGWTDLYVYAWGDKEIFAGWPGATTTETKTIAGVEYMVFTVMGNGESENLIFHDNAGNQLADLNITLNQDYYISVTAEGAQVVDAPSAQEYKIYIQNLTGWANFYVYAWGDVELFGGWPGVAPTETATVDGVDYLVLTVSGLGEGENLIFNDNNGTQYDAAYITLDKDYYIVANTESAQLK